MTVIPFPARWHGPAPSLTSAEGVLMLARALMEEHEAWSMVDRYAADDFSADLRHPPIFRAMDRLVKSGTPIDPVTLTEELQRAGEYELAGGFTAISLLIDIWIPRDAYSVDAPGAAL